MSEPMSKKESKKALGSLPGKFSVIRAISPSPAVFFHKNKAGDINPLTLDTMTGIGTFSAYEHQYSPKAKTDDQMGDSNIWRSDVANLPHDSDTLMARLNVTFEKALGNQKACNDVVFGEKIHSISTAFLKSAYGRDLSKLYLNNLISGTWLFRNRRALSKTMTIFANYVPANQAPTHRSFSFDVRNKNNVFEGQEFDDLAELVQLALSDGLDSPLLLECEMTMLLGGGAKVYPSELWVNQDDLPAKDRKKHLYIACKKIGACGLTDVKVGNGIRTIDTWHGNPGLPIPVNPYGQHQAANTILRSRSTGRDFYTLLAKTVNNANEVICAIKTEDLSKESCDEVFFVMSNLIRGGVFNANQQKSEEKDESHD